jgi:alanine racemase
MESMRANIREDVKIVAVLKTNGYGHGAVAIMKEMEKLPYVWGYAAATFEEAKELRDSGAKKPIILLGYVFPYCYRDLARLEIRPSCFREDMLGELSAAAEKEGKEILIHIALDTGMGRIGIRPDDEGLSFVRKAINTPGLIVEGMFTHFAKADEEDHGPTHAQIELYAGFRNRIREELGFEIPVCHCSNSAGIIEFPEANMNLVRAGITLYGLWPSSEVSRTIVPLCPVMTLYSRIVYIKEAGPGVSVSYGGTYTTSAEMTRIATIPVGYGDGYPRSLSGKGYVLVCGKKAPILGRVCMDQMMVDITHIPEAREGSLVTLIGRDGEESITMEQLGDLSGRFNYELACDINARVPRVVCGGTLG